MRYEITKRTGYRNLEREVVGHARSIAEANRKVGDLNNKIGSTSAYGWRRTQKED